MLTHPADVIINVVDVTSLERSLYMTLQLRELGRPMVVVLNKMDALKRERQTIDVKKLEQVLGCPVLALSANNKQQVIQFKQQLHKKVVQGIALKQLELDYGQAFEQAISALLPLFEGQEVSARSLAIRALENDLMVINGVSESERLTVVDVQRECQFDIDLHVADVKYTFYTTVVNKCAVVRVS